MLLAAWPSLSSPWKIHFPKPTEWNHLSYLGNVHFCLSSAIFLKNGRHIPAPRPET
jgi:hypothetical protein